MIFKNQKIKLFKDDYVLEELIRRIKNIVRHHQLVLR